MKKGKTAGNLSLFCYEPEPLFILLKLSSRSIFNMPYFFKTDTSHARSNSIMPELFMRIEELLTNDSIARGSIFFSLDGMHNIWALKCQYSIVRIYFTELVLRFYRSYLAHLLFVCVHMCLTKMRVFVDPPVRFRSIIEWLCVIALYNISYQGFKLYILSYFLRVVLWLYILIIYNVMYMRGET